jgi:uncharacterized protein (DUF433 family)
MRQLERIAIDTKIMHGKPCVKGTRIPVYVVLNLLAGGMQEKEILESYPDLVVDDIHACIASGAILAEEEVGILETSRVV